jgi:putative transport protein
MHWLSNTLRQYPEIAVFLTLSVGFLIGKVKIGKFTLGSVTAVLLTGIAIGYMDIKIPEGSKAIFFLLFLFSMGYSIGPQFFQGLKKDGLSQALFSATVCTISLGLAFCLAKIFGFMPGTGAGLLSGANTCSAIIGVSSDTIQQLNIDAYEKKQWLNQIPVAYAVTYIFGTAGTAWFLSVIGPIVLGGNVAEKCKELEAQMGNNAGGENDNVLTAFDRVTFRAYHITNEIFRDGGLSLKETEDYLYNKHKPIYIQRIKRDGKILENITPDTRIYLNDLIAISGQREEIMGIGQFLGDEIIDQELLNFPVEIIHVMVVNKRVLKQKLGTLRKKDLAHGIGIKNLMRTGIEMPLSNSTTLEKGDVLELIGPKEDLDKAVKMLGYKEKGGIETDIVYVGAAIVIGTLVGSLSVKVGHVPLQLSTSGGALVAGLFFGWLRTRRPTFGNIPTPSIWLMQKLGLHIFIAIVGLTASSSFIAGLKQEGINLFIAGVILSLLPLFIGLLLARYVFKFHPGIALGACAGAHDESAALLAVQDSLNSKIPALGYTVTYAVANILLTSYGVVIVMLLYH